MVRLFAVVVCETVALQQFRYLLGGDRWRKVMALKLIAMVAPQIAALGLGFDAFGDHAQPQVVADGDHRAHQHGIGAIAGDVGDKGLVDLEFVERKMLQIAETGITGAEIVQTEMHAQPFERLHLLHGTIGIVHEGAFGEFQFQHGRIDAGFDDRVLHGVDKIRALHLHRRDIDADDEIAETGIVPLPDLLAGLAQHPSADLQDQTAVFGNRDKTRGQQQAELRTAPADQRFQADQRAVLGVDLGLIVQHKLVAAQGIAQLTAEQLAIFHRRQHLVSEHRRRVTTALLGLPRSQFGLLGQRQHAIATIRVGRKSHRSRQIQGGVGVDHATGAVEGRAHIGALAPVVGGAAVAVRASVVGAT